MHSVSDFSALLFDPFAPVRAGIPYAANLTAFRATLLNPLFRYGMGL
ncbi:MAG: hypothetical protein ACOY3N_23310 [Bradyrhizobium sp.]